MTAVTRRGFLGIAVIGSATAVLAACGGASSTGQGQGASPGVSPGASKPSALQNLIAAANKEGKVSFADVGAPEVLAALNKKFNERFGTNISVSLVPLPSPQVETRLRSETSAGKVTVDVVHPSSAITLSLLDNKVDAFEPFDWAGTFGSVLPEIPKLAERVPEDLHGLGLEHQHLVRAINYNSTIISAADVPKTWDDLANPKWKGKKLAIEPTGDATYLLTVKWDPAKVVEYSKQIAALDPLWITSGPTLTKAMARGEAGMGISTLNSVFDYPDVLKIAPIGFFPAVQQIIFPVKHSPNINAARLWSAWLTAEGLAIQSDMGQNGERAWPDSNSRSSKLIAETHGELAMLNKRDQLKVSQDTKGQIVAEYKKLGVG